MNLIKRIANNPFAVANFWEDDLDRFLQTRFNTLAENTVLSPNIDVVEDEDEVRVEVELPGLSTNDFNVEAVDGVLVIKGQKTRETKEEKEKYSYRERSFGSFQRNIRLPRTVQADKIEAKLKDGILQVRIPKREEVKPRQIQVNAG